MENKIKKLINEAVNCLDWNIIASYYREFEKRYDNKQVRRETTKNEIKREITNICKFVIDNSISYFDQEQFIIMWNADDDEFGGKLEIIFVPTRGSAKEKREDDEEDDDREPNSPEDIDISKMEIKALEQML